MADGTFPGLVSRTRDVNSASNVIYVQLADNGGNGVTVTGNKLDVNATITGLDTAYVDDSVFVIGTDKVNAQGFLADETATDSVDEGDIGLARMTLDRRMITSSEQSGVWDIGTVTTLTGITNDVSIDDGGNSITVDGTVAATQSGTWVLGANDGVDIGDVTINNAAGAAAVNIQDGGNSITVDGSVAVTGTVAATQSGVWDIGTVTTLTGITNDVNIADGGNSITVDNATLSVVGGGTEATALRVTIANDSTGVITVDASDLDIRDLTHVSDSVQVGDGTEIIQVNTDGSINVNVIDSVVETGETHDYDVGSAIASDATDNHDYAVANSVFLLKSVIVSGSGNVKAEIQVGPVASLVTKAVVFLNGRQGDTQQVFFDPAIEVPVASTGTVRVIRTNRQGAATDVYSTIIGYDK